VGFQRKDLAVYPEITDPVFPAENKGFLQAFCVMGTQLCNTFQPFLFGKPGKVFCSDSAKGNRMVPEDAAKAESDH
jgi:hypothetical protein